jgi:tripartite-type tricarboxylate transporter receptor subunit TctC
LWQSSAREPPAPEPVADFYRGKTISLIVGNPVGNDYDYRGRLIARHIGKHIPGNPAVVPRNMPGAGGLIAANWMAKLAPQDGTTLFMIAQPHSPGQAMALPNISSTCAPSLIVIPSTRQCGGLAHPAFAPSKTR